MIDLGKIGEILNVGVVDKTSAAEQTVDAVGRLLRKDDPKMAEQVTKSLMNAPGLTRELSCCLTPPRTLYTAGWRPAAAWICVAGLAFYLLINPMLMWITGKPGPVYDTAFIVTIITTLSSLGILRSVDKATGSA